MSDTVVQNRKKLQRVAAEDFSFAEEALKTAELLIVPEDQTQRAAFEKLMPHLYVLRNKGCSWPQLTTLLNKSGFKLQPSTVRTYYSEMLVKSMNLCQARMNQQLAIMAKLREENTINAGGSTQLSAMAQRVTAQLSKTQQHNASRVNAMFELNPAPPASPVQTALPSPAAAVQPPAVAGDPAPRQTRARPAPVAATPAFEEEQSAESSNEFGLLGLGPAQHSADRPAGFFSLDTAPGSSPAAARPTPPRQAVHAPAPAPAPAPASPPPSPEIARSGSVIKKRCSPLISNIAAMKKRDNVPKEVYETGEMEHPAIPGLMLTMKERMYGAALEYCDESGDEAGVLRTETADEKRFRVTWRKVVPMTPTRTAESFIKMDNSLFGQGRS